MVFLQQMFEGICWNNERTLEYCSVYILIVQVCVLQWRMNALFLSYLFIYRHFFCMIYVCLQLQLKLLTNGFRLLKVGGSLIYSTCRCIPQTLPLALKSHTVTLYFYCFYLLISNFFFLISLTVAQNEDVVEQFLKENASAGRSFCSRDYSMHSIPILSKDKWNIWRF